METLGQSFFKFRKLYKKNAKNYIRHILTVIIILKVYYWKTWTSRMKFFECFKCAYRKNIATSMSLVKLKKEHPLMFWLNFMLLFKVFCLGQSQTKKNSAGPKQQNKILHHRCSNYSILPFGMIIAVFDI